MGCRMTQGIQAFGALGRNPLQRGILIQHAAQIHQTPVYLGCHDAAPYSSARREFFDPSPRRNVDGFTVGKCDVNTSHVRSYEMVGTGRIELPTSSVSRKRSPTELRACRLWQERLKRAPLNPPKRPPT